MPGERGPVGNRQRRADRVVSGVRQPAWQRRGTGLYWETVEKEGYNPKKKEKVVAQRQRIRCDEELPAGDAYDQLLTRTIP